jgi:hypothetical protein
MQLVDGEKERSSPHLGLLFAIIFIVIFLLHAPLLELPYFWDEAGYYIPAARDLLLTGSLIPHSTTSNAHPPLVMAWLALWWKVAGYAPLVTRSAMLVLAAFSLFGVFRLAARISNSTVAVASTVCTALYPVWFVQSSLAHLDLAAAGLTLWGLSAWLGNDLIAAIVWFSLAALAKETAILTPLALAIWEISGYFARKSRLRVFWPQQSETKAGSVTAKVCRTACLVIPIFPLAAWYAYHYAHTGYVFGNPEFFRYNIAATLNPTRVVLALAMRLWQVLGYLHLWVLTVAALLAMWLLPPMRGPEGERPRIILPKQMIFYVVIAAYVVAMALIGGAVLARYMLPVIPLVIILCMATLWRRFPYWQAGIGCVVFAFVMAWFSNPPYGFAPEDNLAYRDYILLHEDAERFVEARYPMARVLTAWPASDEIARPWLGYITRPMRVVRIENFSLEEVLSAADFRSNYEVALVFSTKYEPEPAPWDRWQTWTKLKSRFFGFHRDLPPTAIAKLVGGHIVYSPPARQGQWIAVIEIDKSEIQNADVQRRRDDCLHIAKSAVLSVMGSCANEERYAHLSFLTVAFQQQKRLTKRTVELDGRRWSWTFSLYCASMIVLNCWSCAKRFLNPTVIASKPP